MAKANKTEMISVRFDASTLERLERVATADEMPTSALIRKWVIQRLQQEAPIAPGTTTTHTVELEGPLVRPEDAAAAG